MRFAMDEVTVHVDGATAGAAHVGIAAVARSANGHWLGWQSRQMGRMTNNEAEYLAALLGLELAGELGARRVVIVTDSDVVVRQMQGQSRVLSKRLQSLHKQTVEAARYFALVTFHHVPREENRLADALAAEALVGRTVQMPARAANPVGFLSGLRRKAGFE